MKSFFLPKNITPQSLTNEQTYWQVKNPMLPYYLCSRTGRWAGCYYLEHVISVIVHSIWFGTMISKKPVSVCWCQYSIATSDLDVIFWEVSRSFDTIGYSQLCNSGTVRFKAPAQPSTLVFKMFLLCCFGTLYVFDMSRSTYLWFV